MFNAISALNGASFTGLAELCDAGLRGMITLRADLSSNTVIKCLKKVTGCAMPGAWKAVETPEATVAWMSPDELLIIVPYEAVETMVAQLTKDLAAEHALVVNVSDARACLTLSGVGAREVLAKVAPIDLAPDQFKAGDFRRTRLAQAAGALWLDQSGVFHIVCFRSVGAYVFDLLKVAADPQSAVGVFAHH